MEKIIYFLVGICNGLFGAGGGAILVSYLSEKKNMVSNKAFATTLSVTAVLSIITVVAYYFKVEFEYKILWSLIIGGFAGSFIGSKILNKLPSNVTNKIFGIILIVVGVRMIL